MMFRWDINDTQERTAAALESVRSMLCYAFLYQNKQREYFMLEMQR